MSKMNLAGQLENCPIPTCAIWLGYAGLLPFAVSALAIWSDGFHDLGARSLVGYGAVIISFIGAVHWGLALSAPTGRASSRELVFSVIPAVVGWIAVLMPSVYGIAILLITFVSVWSIEQIAFTKFLPEWYVGLRNWLSAGALVCLIVGWFGTI